MIPQLVALGVIVALLYSTNVLFFNKDDIPEQNSAETSQSSSPGGRDLARAFNLVNQELLGKLKDGNGTSVNDFSGPEQEEAERRAQEERRQADVEEVRTVAAEIAEEIGMNWRISEELYGQNYAIVAITLKDSGKVAAVETLYSTENRFFDNSLRRAIRKGEPYRQFKNMTTRQREQLTEIVLHFGAGKPPTERQLASIRRSRGDL
jgi:outer membrane biosynthesis protein TonB